MSKHITWDLRWNSSLQKIKSDTANVQQSKSKDKKNKDYFNLYSYNNEILTMCPAPGI